MPPRWLLIAVIAVYSSSWIRSVMTADLHNTLPVASNGWRPIVGTQVKPYATIEQQSQKQTISLTSNDHQEHANKLEKNKLAPNQKGNGGNQVHINHHGSTGHHLLTLHKSKPQAPSKPGSSGGKPAPRHPVLGKLHAHLAHGKRHKPSGTPPPPLPRDEIMAPAPSSAIGSYAYFNQGPISIQNTQLVNNKPYHSPGHVDFSNHFAFSNVNNDVMLPQQPYNYQKHPSQNELHPNHYVFINQNDDFTRNLVPPPPIYKPQGEKETLLVKEPQKPQQTIPIHNSHREEISHLPENIIVQLAPSYKQYSQHNQPSFDLEITKENFKEYHTTLAPSSYKTSTESFLDATKYTKQRELFTKPSLHGYEVTEEKEWVDQLPAFKAVYPTLKPNDGQQQYKNRFHFVQQQQQQQDLNRPSESVQLQYSQQDDSPPSQQFLPTPYNPVSAFPTSPTQAEVSTIYSEISQMNKKKNAYKVPSTTVYNLKEVATHFPIYSNNKTPDTQINIPSNQEVQEYVPEVTTRKEEEETESTLPYSKPTPQTTFPTRGTWEQRRPSHRRRRPRPTTTTEAVVTDEAYQYQSQTPQTLETERPSIKPHRRRRPTKYRTTEAPRETTEATTRTYRPRPTRPQPQTITEEVFVSKNHRHRPTYQYNQEDDVRNKYETTKPEENIYTNTEDNIEYTQSPATEIIRINNHQYEEEDVVETEQPVRLTQKNKRLRPILTTTTTEVLQNTNLNIPENELDYTTTTSNDDQSEESVTIKEIYDEEVTTFPTTSSTPAATTPTTTEALTTKTHRIRQRPIKYDVHRPRFSVKDYRQRLNQYMSTSTTESTKYSQEPAPIRIRYPPNRLKTSTPNGDTDESTEPTRQKYIPKDNRRKYYSTEASEISSTEKYLRTMNPRLKPFGRYRSTSEATPPTSSTTQRVAIKSNIFNNLKRPQQLSLRNRIYNKKRNGTTTTTTEFYTEEPENDSVINTERTEVTIPFEIAESKIEVTTQLFVPSEDTEVLTTTSGTTRPTEVVKIQEVSAPDETEAFLQLQRISDLTSSAHKQYNTPGMFKSVSPTSRRVPSYFTIATEDPILPIEAFFPNLNQKAK